ncbi:MAG: hypothetical protein ACM3SY_20220 [Candidatus Omnitrophota bacterium]
MKILIIDPDVINSSKLKLVLSKYGECDIVSSGTEAVEMFIKSHEQSDPYELLSIESAIQDIPGMDIPLKIREWESAHPTANPTKMWVILAEHETTDWQHTLEEKGAVCLVKPIDRKKLETVLARMGIEKSPIEIVKKTPPPAEPITTITKKNEESGEKTKRAPSKDLTHILKKITDFIANAEQFKGADVPQILADLIKSGGEEAELLVAQYMSSDKTPDNIRQDLIRASGYILGPHFMIVLNKILNSEDNIKTIQEAIMAIAKYDNQRALNVLNQALTKFKNPMLLNAIRGEIARIKKNKPILAILPRFLQEYNNAKNFNVTIDILKKIVTPEDIPLFLNYLKSRNQTLEDGSFEILCHAGDRSIKTTIFNYFEDRIPRIAGLREDECNELVAIVSHLYAYLQKDFTLVEELVNEIKELFTGIKDKRAKQVLIAILAKSQKPEALEFLKTVYNQEKDLNEDIIEQLSGNQQAVDFLFEKYHQGQALKDKVLVSLLKTEEGLRYFIQHFFTFDLDKQEFILKHIQFSARDFLLDFIKKIYASNLYGLKFQLLRILRGNFLFDFKDILFDDNHQREFMFMGNDYLDTIMELFPISSIRMFFNKIPDEEVSISKVIKYLSKIAVIAPYEPVIPFNDATFINRLFSRILNANNIDLNTRFFTSLENIKFLDLKSYKFLLDALHAFAELRGENINPKEIGAISRLKTRLREQFQDIRELETLQPDLNDIFSTAPIQIERLEKLFDTNHKAVALKIHHVAAFLAVHLNSAVADESDIEVFYMKYPMIAKFVKHLTAQKQSPTLMEDWTDNSTKMDLLKHFRSDLKIVLSFTEKRKSAFIMDQLLQVIPEFQIVIDEKKLRETDLLVCDAESLREYIDSRTLKTKRLCLYLENRSDFAPFRAYNPKVFMKPFSAYRVLRVVLQELYIQK